MDLVVIVTFLVVFGWVGIVAWRDLFTPARRKTSVQSVVVLDREVLVEWDNGEVTHGGVRLKPSRAARSPESPR